MTATRLTQTRVHEIIKDYAAENNGEIPSTTDIIVLNDGHGSASSASTYRKTYIAMMDKQRRDESNKNPLESFPKAIADAVAAMEESIRAKAQEETDALRAEFESRLGELKGKLEQAHQDMETLTAEKDELSNTVKLRQFEIDSLKDDLTDKNKQLQSMSHAMAKLEGERSEARAQNDRLKDHIEPLPSIIGSQADRLLKHEDAMMKNTESINANLAGLEKQISGFKGEIVRLENSKASMIEENSKLSDTIARQSDQYQAEFNRLNQLVDDLRMSNEQLRQTEIDVKNDALLKAISDVAASNSDICKLVAELATHVKTLN